MIGIYSYSKVQYKSPLKSSGPALLFVESFFKITYSIALLVINLKIFYFIMIQPYASQVALGLVKNPPAKPGDTRDAGSIPRLGRSPVGGNSNPLQYSCLENSMEESLVGYSPQGRRVQHD